MSNEERIPLFLSADNNYAPFVATTIASVLMHTNSPVDFYVLEDGITEANKIKIQNTRKFFKDKDFNVIFIDATKNKNYKNIKFALNTHVTKATYTKFIIPELDELKHIKKAIYSDVDVIFVDDIKKMYDIDLEGKPLGAIAYELFGEKCTNDVMKIHKEKLIKKFNAPEDFLYFLGGNLIIDCEYWRKNDISKKLWKVCYMYQDDPEFIVDQYAMNIVFGNNYKPLPPRWCFAYDILWYLEKFCPNFDKTVYDEEFKKVVILHYSYDKPWKSKKGWQAEQFWRIVPYTDFAKIINKMPYLEKISKIKGYIMRIIKKFFI